MEVSQRKACFSDAYACAIAAALGLEVAYWKTDLDSVDMTLKAGPQLEYGRAQIDIQLKCGRLAIRPNSKSPTFPYRLKRKNYDDLRDPNLSNPKLLVLLNVPSDNTDDWLEHTESHLALKRCAYWHSIRLEPDVDQEQIVIRVPLAQTFTPTSLKELMRRMKAGTLK